MFDKKIRLHLVGFSGYTTNFSTSFRFSIAVGQWGNTKIHISAIRTSKHKIKSFILCLVYVRIMVTLCLLAFLPSSLYSLDYALNSYQYIK